MLVIALGEVYELERDARGRSVERPCRLPRPAAERPATRDVAALLGR